MDPRVKALSRDVAASASEELAGREATDAQLLALIATTALRKLEEALPGESDADSRREARRARKLLSSLEPAPLEHNVAVETQGLDLGQYSHTEVFDGKAKKAEKFARLMGGAKCPKSPTIHATYAPPSDVLHKINDDVEAQFNDAVHRKGKQGLGA